MNLEEDIRQIVLRNLPHDARFTAELEAMTAPALLIIFYNWQSRLVSQVPRRIHRSKALMQNPLAVDVKYKAALDAVILKLETGIDVTAHLSRGVRYGYKPSQNGRTRQDIDLLLNDWNVHHLHISTHIQADGFVERTGPLLFAILRPNDAYLIDLVNHGGWYRDHIIETIVREWPNENLVWEMKGIIPSGKRLTETERKNLRGNHYNAHFEIDGKTFMPAGGLTTAGTSTRNTMWVQRLFRTLDWFKKELDANPNLLANASIAQHGVALPAQPEFRFDFFPDGHYGLVEQNTGLRFRLPQ